MELDHKMLNRQTLEDLLNEEQKELLKSKGINPAEIIAIPGIEGLQGIKNDGSDSPTVENISNYIANKIAKVLEKNYESFTVETKVYETPNSYATKKLIYTKETG